MIEIEPVTLENSLSMSNFNQNSDQSLTGSNQVNLCEK